MSRPQRFGFVVILEPWGVALRALPQAFTSRAFGAFGLSSLFNLRVAGMNVVGDRHNSERQYGVAVGLASPKSSTFTMWSRRTITFSGLGSR